MVLSGTMLRGWVKDVHYWTSTDSPMAEPNMA